MGSSRSVRQYYLLAIAIMVGYLWIGSQPKAYGIDVNLTMEEATKALASGRESMEKAEQVTDVATIMKAATSVTRSTFLRSILPPWMDPRRFTQIS